jgi:hypothetical protein
MVEKLTFFFFFLSLPTTTKKIKSLPFFDETIRSPYQEKKTIKDE